MISAKRIASMIIPVIVLGFIIVTIGGKFIEGVLPETDPYIEAKKTAKAALKSIERKYRERFDRYFPKSFRGVPTIIIIDDRVMQIEYTLERSGSTVPNPEDAESQFHRLICRETLFTDLYYMQQQLKADTPNTLDVVVTVSVLQPSDPETPVWKIIITPESCLRKGH